MIKENQRLLNRLNVLSDAVIVFLSMPLAFFVRFYIFRGIISVPLRSYILLALGLTVLHLATCALGGLYQSQRISRLSTELKKLFIAQFVNMLILLSYLFIGHEVHYSRETLAIFFLFSFGLLSLKRVLLRLVLRRLRSGGFNQKRVLIIGGGRLAIRYLEAVRQERAMGYSPVGYIAASRGKLDIDYFGDIDALEQILDRERPDEVVCALDIEEQGGIGTIVSLCEKTGTKLSVIPFFADYMTPSSQVDEINGLPLMNIRRVPLDNWINSLLKRTVDVVGSLILIILSSPAMLVCAIGVKLSSPGPIIFRQERVGLNKRNFPMYKFRSMRTNDRQNTAWSTNEDSRKTPFGSFIRKYSLDELPQFFNVLKGDMSLVGPRPEIPFHVERFKEEIPLYMVKHQVRPGITGLAQIRGLRGDTSIEERIKCDIEYIEHWSFGLDIKILLVTVFGGKFKNSEVVKIK